MRATSTAVFMVLMAFSVAHAQDRQASATMMNAEGNEAGTVTFAETPSGVLHIIVEMTGMPPGAHGFHIHETGECDPEGGFESAGGHYVGDDDNAHGIMNPEGPHAGDLPNVHVGQDGVLKIEYFTDELSISGDDSPLMDEDGSAVVVHGSPDDYESQPSGEAGDRIACGVIE